MVWQQGSTVIKSKELIPTVCTVSSIFNRNTTKQMSSQNVQHPSSTNPSLVPPPPQRNVASEGKREREALWLNALRLLAVNSPPSPLGWPLLWTYEPCHSVWCWETVQGLLIKYYSPLNGWRLASVGMLGLNLPPGQMCVCVCVCAWESVCVCVCVDMKGKAGREGVVVHVPQCKWIACF